MATDCPNSSKDDKSRAQTGKLSQCERCRLEQIQNRTDPSGDKRGTDSRHSVFKEAITQAWKAKNSTPMTWDGSEGKKLADLLSANPTLTEQAFREMLRNRNRSQVNHAERPRSWLDRITDYANGPLDRFRQPLVVPIAQSPSPPIDALEEIREKKKKAMEEIARENAAAG